MLRLIIIFTCFVARVALAETNSFEFEFNGNALRGIIDTPKQQQAKSLIVIIPGHGKTNIVNGQWADLRSLFMELGITTVAWDKAGCGKSEGEYDHQQSVQSSAHEVYKAIKAIESRSLPGSERIGLWGISRAGWIAPLVMSNYPRVSFWISVSGTDEKESFGYMLRSNLEVEGHSNGQIESLYQEWLAGNKVFQSGGSWEEYKKATRHLRENQFVREYIGIGTGSESDYLENQKQWLKEQHIFDKETGLRIYVKGLRAILSNIQIPVLALFGEKDMQVDWRSAMSLYSETIDSDLLTIKRFPDGNHNIQKSVTGGLRESMSNAQKWNPSDGYYGVMRDWLKSIGVTSEPNQNKTGL